jgi:prepilin-type N-terminal cleavage/methylation domain-containing protein
VLEILIIKKLKTNEGFTLIELLVVVAILGILSSIILVGLTRAKSLAAFARTQLEFKSLVTAIELYTSDRNGVFPADVNRGLPPGLEAYLSGGNWPNAPWPGSVYDWENWIDPATGLRILQISVRFCPTGRPDLCRFPDEPWAVGFDINSAVYYCIEGACRPHINEPMDHPGYCVNC